MSGPTAGLPAAEIAAADALRRLGEGLIGRNIDTERSAEVARRLEELVTLVGESPSRTKVEAYARYQGHQRIGHYVEYGRWPDPPPDGEEVTFDALSFVGGRLNPFAGGVRYYRDGDEVVAKANLSASYEGPPNRIHGGMVAAVFDEVMGAVFRVRAMASSFTGTLTVRYTGPAPLDEEIVFRARLTETRGRKHFVEASASSGSGPVAEAEATFIQMSDEQFAAAIGAI